MAEAQQPAPGVVQLAASMGQELEDRRRLQQQQQLWHRPTIHRVFPRIRREDGGAYEPRLVSIGPLHRDKEPLLAMEVHKWRYLRDLLARCPGNRLERCVAGVGARVEEIRGQYSEKLDAVTDDDLVKMMVLDGCFVIELLIKTHHREADSAFSAMAWVFPIFWIDLLLVENQIPYFVLEVLFQATAPRPRFPDVPTTLTELALLIMSDGAARVMPVGSLQPSLCFLHWLHLYHSFLVSQPPKEEPRLCWPATCHGLRRVRKIVSHVGFLIASGLTCSPPDCSFDEGMVSSTTIPRATRLREAGVMFRGGRPTRFTKTELLSMKVTFANGTLEMPALPLGDNTYRDLQSLVTFEQCCPEFGTCFTSLAHLMGHLMETDGDVALLRDCGVVPINALGSLGDVVLFFSNLRSGTYLALDRHYYAGVIKDVNEYCKSDRRRWRAG